MGVQFGQGRDYSGFGNALIINSVDIVFVNLVKDEIEFAPVVILDIEIVLAKAVSIVGRYRQGTHYDAKNRYQDR